MGSFAFAGLWIVFLIVWLLIVAGAITIGVLFLLTASKCLEQCNRRTREMEPGQVWLCFIPLFGSVWIFFVILKLEQSLKREFRDRNLRPQPNYGQPLGLAFAITCVASSFVGMIPILNLLAPLGMIAGFVLWIMYWMKIKEFLAKLEGSRPSRRRPSRPSRDDDDEDEEEDERPSRRRSSRRDEVDEEDDDEVEERPSRRRRRPAEE